VKPVRCPVCRREPDVSSANHFPPGAGFQVSCGADPEDRDLQDRALPVHFLSVESRTRRGAIELWNRSFRFARAGTPA
jgi:hypothetical protein